MRILKHELPIDDEWHLLDVKGGIVEVGHQQTGTVSLWFVEYDPGPRFRSFRVYGTGHDIPSATAYIGTTIDPDLNLVWHVVQK